MQSVTGRAYCIQGSKDKLPFYLWSNGMRAACLLTAVWVLLHTTMWVPFLTVVWAPLLTDVWVPLLTAVWVPHITPIGLLYY